MPTLIVFDIDGTLLHSVAPHRAAFIDALRAVGLTSPDTDWGRYRHLTDSWIFREVFRSRHGRAPGADEFAGFDRTFAELFEARIGAGRVAALDGAPEFVRRLHDEPDVAVVYATGGLSGVTEAKLRSTGLEAPAAGIATASDHTYREHVVREAVHRATAAQDGGAGFDRVIAFGDGPWDVRAAVAFGFEFVGVGESGRAFGPWFPATHLINRYEQVDLGRDYTLAPPPDAVPPAPESAGEFTAGPGAACVCWS